MDEIHTNRLNLSSVTIMVIFTQDPLFVTDQCTMNVIARLLVRRTFLDSEGVLTVHSTQRVGGSTQKSDIL